MDHSDLTAARLLAIRRHAPRGARKIRLAKVKLPETLRLQDELLNVGVFKRLLDFRYVQRGSKLATIVRDHGVISWQHLLWLLQRRAWQLCACEDILGCTESRTDHISAKIFRAMGVENSATNVVLGGGGEGLSAV